MLMVGLGETLHGLGRHQPVQLGNTGLMTCCLTFMYTNNSSNNNNTNGSLTNWTEWIVASLKRDYAFVSEKSMCVCVKREIPRLSYIFWHFKTWNAKVWGFSKCT